MPASTFYHSERIQDLEDMKSIASRIESSFKNPCYAYVETTTSCTLARCAAAEIFNGLDTERIFEGRVFDQDKEYRFTGPASGSIKAWHISELPTGCPSTTCDRRYYLHGEWLSFEKNSTSIGVFREGKMPKVLFKYPLDVDEKHQPVKQDKCFILVREYRKQCPGDWESLARKEIGIKLGGPLLIGHRFIGIDFGKDCREDENA